MEITESQVTTASELSEERLDDERIRALMEIAKRQAACLDASEQELRNRNLAAPTWREICLHETKGFIEMQLINLFCATVVWLIGISYEVGILVILSVFVRSKFSDYNQFPVSLPYYFNWLRLVFLILAFCVEVSILNFYSLGPIPYGKRILVSNYQYSSRFAEVTFVTNLYSTLVLLLRIWTLLGVIFCNIMEAAKPFVSTFAEIEDGGAGGDGLEPRTFTRSDFPPTSFSYPVLRSRKRRHTFGNSKL